MNTENNSNAHNVGTSPKGERFGLWVGLGAATLTAIGVVSLAIYTDYQENNRSEVVAASAAAEQAPSTIPTSQAQAESIAAQTSDQQVQGMTAPSDEEESGKTPVFAASQMGTASGVVEANVVGAASAAANAHSVLQPVLPQQPASNTTVITAVAPASASAASVPSPADKILAKENALQAESRVVAENGVVRFYFATGKADVTANTLESLKDTVEGVKAGKKVQILTYSSVESNERLARDRALAVRSVLLAAGIPDGSIEVSNPTAESGDSRRVDVVLR